jgi:hypothetical protein
MRRWPNELALMPITTDADTNSYAWSTTLRLAGRFSLTLYDVAYLELAQRRSLPLATLDKELRAAAPALNITLLGAAGEERCRQIDDLQITLKDFLPEPSDRKVISDRSGAAAIVRADLLVKLKDYSAANQVPLSPVVDQLHA